MQHYWSAAVSLPPWPQHWGWHSGPTDSSQPRHRSATHGSGGPQRHPKSLGHRGPPLTVDGHVWLLLGVGPAFCQLVQLLLSGTRARVRVGGFLSRSTICVAGVCQGCPLAPLLYLFVAECVSWFLLQRGLGMLVAGSRLPCLQFADDTNAFLADISRVSGFLAAMDSFGAASGQRLNLSKTKVMLLTLRLCRLTTNQFPPRSPASTQLVSQATILGIPFVSTAPASGGQREAVVDWAALEPKCVQRLHKLGVLLPLSAFGNGFASARTQLILSAQCFIWQNTWEHRSSQCCSAWAAMSQLR